MLSGISASGSDIPTNSVGNKDEFLIFFTCLDDLRGSAVLFDIPETLSDRDIQYKTQKFSN
jgi:hypothetical protein